MTYIIKHDFDQDIPYYVRVVDSATFDEVYNPKFATHFKSKKEAQQWINLNSKFKEYSKVAEYNKSVSDYVEWETGGTVRRTLSCINRKVSRPYNNESLDEVIVWWIYQKHNDDEIDYEDYKTWPKLHSISKYLWDVEGYYSKDHTEIYLTFQLRSLRDGVFCEFQAELNKVIDKVTYKDEDGYMIFPIFDHFLSEHGNSVCLLIHPETNKVKIGGRWRQNEYNSLEEAFNYIKKERYYE